VPPRSWPGVLSSPGPYTFPAGGQGGLVNDAFLIQYLAVRGWPASGLPGEAFLDQESLVTVLQFYQDGVTRGVLPGYIVDYHDKDACWRDYLAGQAALTHVRASRYMADRASCKARPWPPYRASTGPPRPSAGAGPWPWSHRDPARQALAAELMARMMEVETNAAWNRAAGTLPTRQAVLDAWRRWIAMSALSTSSSWLRSRAPLANYTQIAAALQDAVKAVVTGAARARKRPRPRIQQVP
jgi:hypothetical protein